MSAFNLTPVDNNYLTSLIRYQQLTQNTDVITVNSSNFTASTTPKVLTFGDGVVRLQGTVVAAGTPAANYEIGSLPTWCVPLGSDQVYPVAVLRAGAYVSNAVSVNIGGDSIESVTITAAGSYQTLPTLSISGTGTGATLTPIMKVVSAIPSADGTGYAPADKALLIGGTSSVDGELTVATTKVISAAVDAPGTDYAPGNTITVNGGTPTTNAVFTVGSTKVVSAGIVLGGSGGTDGSQTVTGTTGTGTKFEASVTIAGGSISSVDSITVAGNYTVNPTDPSQEPVTGASLTGAVLNLGMGVLTAPLTTAGVYTANASSFTQVATSGSGTGVTFNTVVYGVNAVTVKTAGSYTALPTNPVSVSAITGAGTGAQFTVLWGLLSATITNKGSGYSQPSTLVITGGGGAGGGAGTVVLDSSANNGVLKLVNQPTAGDIVVLDSVNFTVESYKSQ